MQTIKETDFDLLVKHTLRIDLKDGTVLLYDLTPQEKQEFINRLRQHSFGFEDTGDLPLLLFYSFPRRAVFLNTAYVMRIIFCFDHPAAAGESGYRDNFDVLEKDAKTENNFAVLPAAEDIDYFLPQAIIKLSHSVSYAALNKGNVLTFSDLEPGALAGLEAEAEMPEDGLRTFIALMDEDGEDNFIPLKEIICLEADRNILDEEYIKEKKPAKTRTIKKKIN